MIVTVVGAGLALAMLTLPSARPWQHRLDDSRGDAVSRPYLP